MKSKIKGAQIKSNAVRQNDCRGGTAKLNVAMAKDNDQEQRP